MANEDPFQKKAEENRRAAGRAFNDMVKKNDEFINKMVQSEMGRFKEPTDTKEDLLMAQASHMAKKRVPVVTGAQDPDDIPSFEIEGHRLPLTGNYKSDALTVMMYIFGAVLAPKNKRIRAILDEANFQFKDLDNNFIYPKKKKRKVKTHAKRKKRKTRKRSV